MKSNFLKFLVCFLVASTGYSQSEFNVKIKLNHYEQDTLILGYYFGENMYSKDTAIKQGGYFTFQSKKDVHPGVYMAVLHPNKNVFQFLIDKDNSDFSIEADASDLSELIKSKGSKANELFFKYIHFINSRKKIADKFRKLAGESKDENTKASYAKKLDSIDLVVKQYQDELVKENPKSFVAKIIETSQEKTIPNYTTMEPQTKLEAFAKFKAHYFDNFDFVDERLFYSPVYYQRINNYIQNMTVQHPDSINRTLDYLLEKMVGLKPAYQFYLSHFLNTYIKSKFVGMDGVYVHLIDEYYSNGKADWVEKENLRKIQDAANDVRPTLIGRVAPNLQLIKMDSTNISLHAIKADYLVVVFWAPDCGHCEKAMPAVTDFYDKFHPNGVEVLAICTGLLEEAKDCWKKIKEKDMLKFINAYDPLLRSNFKILYDIKATPKIFILDKNKKILSKNIGSDQLEKVMQQILEIDKKENKSQ